jgi:hypothetical protein
VAIFGLGRVPTEVHGSDEDTFDDRCGQCDIDAIVLCRPSTPLDIG